MGSTLVKLTIRQKPNLLLILFANLFAVYDIGINMYKLFDAVFVFSNVCHVCHVCHVCQVLCLEAFCKMLSLDSQWTAP